MAEILGLPYKAENLANHVAAVSEFDDPPDYNEFFWARQYGYAVLGLEVSELARKLREHTGIPYEPYKVGEWNRDDALREQRDKIAAEREAYQRRVTDRWTASDDAGSL